MKKILIIRFSSFGDIVQALVASKKLKEKYPGAKIHWLTKKEFKGLVELSPYVDSLLVINKKDGLAGLLRIIFEIKNNHFDLIYDAHSNLRSLLIRICLRFFFYRKLVIVRPKERWKRFLLFRFRKDQFGGPYQGMRSYLKPLDVLKISHQSLHQNWNFEKTSFAKVEKLIPFLDQKFLVLAPSAAWKMKRWPEESWKILLQKLPNTPLVMIGGPSDSFIDDIFKGDENKNHLNLTGQLSLIESSLLVSKATLVVSADTGIIHVADLLGVSGLSLIGPTAFGFPTNQNIKTIESELSCRPCSKDGRGKCSQDIYQKCMVNISPDLLEKEVLSYF